MDEISRSVLSFILLKSYLDEDLRNVPSLVDARELPGCESNELPESGVSPRVTWVHEPGEFTRVLRVLPRHVGPRSYPSLLNVKCLGSCGTGV